MNMNSPAPSGADWANINGRSFPRLDLPKVSGVDAVDQAGGRYRDLIAQWTAATGEINRLNARPVRAAAEARDTQAFAEAIATGGKDPGQQYLHAHESAQRDLVRRRDALAVAVSTAAVQLVAVIDEHRDQLAKHAADRQATADAVLAGLVDRLEEAAVDAAEARRLVAWVADGPGRRQRWGNPLQVGRVGSPIDTSNICQAIRDALTPTPPPPLAGAKALADAPGAVAA